MNETEENHNDRRGPMVMQIAQLWNLISESPLQPKQFGQLKTLRDRCGPDTLQFIKWVLHSWPEFCDRVRQETSFESVPPLPHVGFLLKFHRIAVAMMADACPERVTYVLANDPAQRDGNSSGQYEARRKGQGGAKCTSSW
jgi:hypothetical protein